jgi:uncharacterized protein YjbJ (UPF0337 family)
LREARVSTLCPRTFGFGPQAARYWTEKKREIRPVAEVGEILAGAGGAGGQTGLARDAPCGCAALPNTGKSFGERFSKEKRRNEMQPSTKDQIEGKFHELKGNVKQKAGQVTNNPDLETKGLGEKLAGKIQKKVGQIEAVLEK